MNFFKLIILIATLCSIDAMNARAIRAPGQPSAPQPQPAPQPAVIKKQPPVQQPPLRQESFNNLVAYTKSASNVWDAVNGKLKTDFVNTILLRARAAGLDTLQLEVLLQTARDIHGIFSGNQMRDIAILQAVDTQINAAVRQL